jgi:hypothetical protein
MSTLAGGAEWRTARLTPDKAIGVDRIGRIGTYDHVARRGQGLGQIGETLLGAQGGDDLGVGIQRHAEPALIIAGHGAAQARNALGGRIAPGFRIARGLDQLVDDVPGRGHVRIAHAEVDDVHAPGAQPRLEAVDLLEHVGRQAADAVEIGGHGLGADQGRRMQWLRTPGGRAWIDAAAIRAKRFGGSWG